MNPSEARGERLSDYEVLSPWAYADPVPLRGVSPRLASLEGRKIGLFSNGKRAAELTLGAFEAQLREFAPTSSTSWYTSTGLNTPEVLTGGKEKFTAWVKDVDAVVLSVAD